LQFQIDCFLLYLTIPLLWFYAIQFVVVVVVASLNSNVAIFAFANFNLSFFILKAKATEISDTNILLLYTLFNVFYAGVSYPFGIVSDRIGRDKVVMMSFAVFIIATLGFAFFSTSLVNVVILFALVGIYMGIFDGSQKAYISEIAHPSYKATALGTVATLTGIITLPSSLVAGILWDKFGPSATFVFSAVIALVALGIFVVNRIKVHT
jgi:MFS family permease